MTNPKPKPTWRTFTLRTTLIVLTAACVFLGLFIAPREQRRQAFRALRARGVDVSLIDNPTNPLAAFMSGDEFTPPGLPTRLWYGTLPAEYTRRVVATARRTNPTFDRL